MNFCFRCLIAVKHMSLATIAALDLAASARGFEQLGRSQPV
jgi:hypothetical protein